VKNIIVFCLCLLLSGYAGAEISGGHDMDTQPATMPKMIYVRDFELEAADIQPGTGPLMSQPERSGPVRKTLKRLRGEKDPAVRSRELVNLMSESLVKELAKNKLTARRIGAADALPAGGLLVRGIFTHVEEGNRLRRAVIGFGSGETEMQLVVSVDDLAEGSPKPLYKLDTGAESSKLPGAVITLNPYVAAAKFVLSGHDLDRNVSKTASKIANYITERIRQQTGSPH
jgi:hypothetical protein